MMASLTNKACMVVHSYYPDDPRVRRETNVLLNNDWDVDVVCLRDCGEKALEKEGNVTIHRLPVRRHRGRGLAIYLAEYLAFFVLAFFRVTQLHLNRSYQLVQVHNMPDFLIFTALVPKLLGARVMLDIHDLVPELYTLRFAGRDNHPFVRLTRWVERISTGFADHVVTAGRPFRRILVERSVPADRVTVVMNSADPDLFSPLAEHEVANHRTGQNDTFRLIYHGGLFERYGLDIAIQAVHRLRDQIPGLCLDIYGKGEAEEDLYRQVQSLDLGDRVHLHGFASIDDIPYLIGNADLGVVPYKRNSFNNLLYPTKAFEYLAMDVPVILSRTDAVYELFAGISGMFVTPDDVDELADRISTLYEDEVLRYRLLQEAQQAYKAYAWENQSQKYLTLIEKLVSVQPKRQAHKTLPTSKVN